MNFDTVSTVADRLEKCYSGAVHDVLRTMGRTGLVLPHDINPLDPSRRLAGPMYTFAGHFQEGMDEHETLLEWTQMLTVAPSGCVLVCQPNNGTVSHMGELSAETLQLRGIRGYIVDGGCRDVEFVVGIGFRVFCKYTTPRDVVGCWMPHRFGEPVRIGSVLMNTGDWVVADRDGVVVIPGGIVDEVVEEAERVMQTESMVRRAILDGMDPKDAYLKYGKF
ncbi:RraA family protein [Bacteroidota bacterium]